MLRSINSGATWTAISGIVVSKRTTTFPDCSGSDPLGDVNAVRFASATRVWLMAEGAQLARSENGGANWVDANKNGTACKVPTGYAEGLGDGFFPTANPSVGYFCTTFFGEVFFTSNTLSSTAAKQSGDCGNGTSPRRRIAGDQVNPNRMWAVSPGGANRSYTSYTQDGWSSSTAFVIGDDGGSLNQTPYDVAFSGGTVIAAGDAGMILVSTDGVNFRHQVASGAQATAGWRAVSLASAGDAAVGGQNGQLAVSSDANVFPAPTTPGPTPVVTPSPTPAAPVLTPVSALQPKTTTTGGTVITIYRLVRVTGHSGRYVPVRIKAKGKRTIKIALYAKGKKRTTSTLTVRFKRKGVRLAKVPLPATAKLGKYTVVVKVYKGRNRTGRSVRQAIVVA